MSLFHKILNNKILFERVTHFIHENHILYNCRVRNVEIDDALWLSQTGSFNVLRDKMQCDASASDERDYRLLFWPADALCIVLEHKYYDIIVALLKHRSPASLRYCFFTTRVLDAAVRSGAPLSIIRKVAKRFPRAVTFHCYASAAEAGRLEVIEWLRSARPDVLPTVETTRSAAFHGHLHIIKYFHESEKRQGHWAPFGRQTLDAAIRGGHREIVRYILDNRNEGLSAESVDLLAASESMHDMIYSLAGRKDVHCTNMAQVAACRQGNLKLLKFLVENERKLNLVHMSTEQPMSMAIKCSDTECFDYLSRLPANKGIDRYMVSRDNVILFQLPATSAKQIEFFHYLKSRKYDLHRNVIFSAVTTGNVELFESVVKQFGMELAVDDINNMFRQSVGHGHLEMTLNLYSKTKKSQLAQVSLGVSLGVFLAVNNPSGKIPVAKIIDILEHLRTYSGQPLEPNVSTILSNGHPFPPPLLSYLFTHYQKGKESNFLSAAARSGCLDIVKQSTALMQYNTELIGSCYNTALSNRHLDITRYLETTFDIHSYPLYMAKNLDPGSIDSIYHGKFNASLCDRLLASPDIQLISHLAKLKAEYMNRQIYNSQLDGLDENALPATEKQLVISVVKNLSHLILLFSKWFRETGYAVKISPMAINRIVMDNRIDEIVYLEEIVKYDIYEPFPRCEQYDTFYHITISLEAGNVETTNYFLDYLIKKHQPSFPRPLYYKLKKLATDDSKEKPHNYRVFRNLDHRLETEIGPML